MDALSKGFSDKSSKYEEEIATLRSAQATAVEEGASLEILKKAGLQEEQHKETEKEERRATEIRLLRTKLQQLQQELDLNSNNANPPGASVGVSRVGQINDLANAGGAQSAVSVEPSLSHPPQSTIQSQSKEEYAQAAELEALVGDKAASSVAASLPPVPATPSSSGVRTHQPGLTPPNKPPNNNPNNVGQVGQGKTILQQRTERELRCVQA